MPSKCITLVRIQIYETTRPHSPKVDFRLVKFQNLNIFV